MHEAILKNIREQYRLKQLELERMRKEQEEEKNLGAISALDG